MHARSGAEARPVYGVEDMHRAVIEAKLQEIFPFCLTIDRQAADYLPGIFGSHQYAMLLHARAAARRCSTGWKRLIAL